MHVNSSQLTQQLILMAAACLPQRKVASTWLYNSLTLTLTLYYTILQYTESALILVYVRLMYTIELHGVQY